jgi:hypothetical protein
MDDDFHIYRYTFASDIENIRDFAAIGSGRWIAEANLFQRKQTPHRHYVPTLYRVYEAQKLGRIAPGVGQTSFTAALSYDDASEAVRHLVVSTNGETALDEAFDKFGPQEIKGVDLPTDVTFIADT